MQAEPLFVGIDVSKDRLDVALTAEGPVSQVPNEPASIAILVHDLAQRNCALIVLEATGAMNPRRPVHWRRPACPWWWRIRARRATSLGPRVSWARRTRSMPAAWRCSSSGCGL